jgi:hypothetical protein
LISNQFAGDISAGVISWFGQWWCCLREKKAHRQQNQSCEKGNKNAAIAQTEMNFHKKMLIAEQKRVNLP